MKRPIIATVVCLLLALPLVAADAEQRVIEQVLAELSRTAPPPDARGKIVLASETVGGAELATTEFLVSTYGRSIGFEISDDYVEQNAERHPVEQILGAAIPHVDDVMDLELLPPSPTVWSAVESQVPGARMIVFVSRPAFDAAETIALVRADVFIKDLPHASTRSILLERQPSGDWKFGLISHGSFAAVHSNRGHRHKPEDAAYFHVRD